MKKPYQTANITFEELLKEDVLDVSVGNDAMNFTKDWLSVNSEV